MTTEEPFDHMQNNYCFITGKRIVDGDDCRFTFEWDAWVSTAGQNLIEEWVANGMKESNIEYETIYREWYAQDAAAAAEDANENNEEFRRWHK